jgi:hypothetical protein
MQWAISISRFDTSTTVMTLSSFRALPCQGHMDCAKGIYGYLAKMKDAVICSCVEEPDLSGVSHQILINLTVYMVLSMNSLHVTRQRLLVIVLL